MSQQNLLKRVVAALDRTGIDYMITGSIASSLRRCASRVRNKEVCGRQSYVKQLRFRSLSIAFAAIVIASVGCGDKAPDIIGQASGFRALFQGDPFYYYAGERIFLEGAPYMTFRIADGAGPDVALEIATAAGVRDTARRLLQADGHWVADLSTKISAAKVVANAHDDPRVTFASIAYKTVSGGDTILLVDRVVVRFKKSASTAQINSLATELGLELERPPQPDSGIFEYYFRYPKPAGSRPPLAIAAELSENSLVEWADPDKISNRRLAKTPRDPFYSKQFYLKHLITRAGVAVDINVEPAWDETLGSGTRIAVIDDGVDASHEDLAGRVGGGYDAWFGQPYPCTDSPTSPHGSDSHGTSVAGIIGARHDGVGIAGIAPETYIVPIRIFCGPESATDAAIARAITYAWSSADADVLSNSWTGGARSNAIVNAINQARSRGRRGKGALVVFAAGNSSNRTSGDIGKVRWPAALSSVIAVGAINRNGALTNYTPEGPELDIVALSSHAGGKCSGEIVTTELMGNAGCNDGPSGNINYTQTFSGTSAAAPQVAAAGILVYSRWPHLTAAQATQQILCATDSWGAVKQFGRGKLNVGRAVASSPPPPCPQP